MNKRRLLTAGAVVVAVAGAVAGVGVASAATDPPPLAFVVATNHVTAQRYDDGEGGFWLDLDFGVNLVPGTNPLEIRATRKSYADPIVASQLVKGKATPLPAGMVTDFTGLKEFSTVVITDQAGKVVVTRKSDFCPSPYDSSRTRPDAPSSSPYPQGCNGANPFTLGAVWGTQAGWNAGLENRYYDSDSQYDLKAGEYSATITVAKKYADFFKMKESVAKLDLTVENGSWDDGGGNPSTPPSAEPSAEPSGPPLAALKAAKAQAEETSAADAEGDMHHQISGYLPGFRPPAKVPATLKAKPKTGPRPDLRSLPAWEISLEQGTDEQTGEIDGKWYVNFGATVWNAGTSPLLVDGFRRTGTDLMDAYQYFFDAKGNQVGSVPAGTMEWDAREGHKHWHFTDFAQYNLLKSDKKLAVRSGKEAFCLANTDAVDYTIPNAMWKPQNTDLSTACGGNTAVAVREVLDIGNGDTYSQFRPGQSFEVTDLPNGTYYIEVKANPANKLAESDTTNNTSLREIKLGGKPGARTLVVPPVHGITG